MLTQEQKADYYRHQAEIKRTILAEARKKRLIVYGSESANKQLPSHLRRPSQDIDLYALNDSLGSAQMIERRLENRLHGDYFYVKPAKHPGTYKVKSRVTMEGVADVTQQEQKVPTKRIGNVRYTTLQYQRHRLQVMARNGVRSKKDLEQLQRINLYLGQEKQKKGKKVFRNLSRQRTFWGSLDSRSSGTLR